MQNYLFNRRKKNRHCRHQSKSRKLRRVTNNVILHSLKLIKKTLLDTLRVFLVALLKICSRMIPTVMCRSFLVNHSHFKSWQIVSSNLRLDDDVKKLKTTDDHWQVNSIRISFEAKKNSRGGRKWRCPERGRIGMFRAVIAKEN